MAQGICVLMLGAPGFVRPGALVLVTHISFLWPPSLRRARCHLLPQCPCPFAPSFVHSCFCHDSAHGQKHCHFLDFAYSYRVCGYPTVYASCLRALHVLWRLRSVELCGFPCQYKQHPCTWSFSSCHVVRLLGCWLASISGYDMISSYRASLRDLSAGVSLTTQTEEHARTHAHTHARTHARTHTQTQMYFIRNNRIERYL